MWGVVCMKVFKAAQGSTDSTREPDVPEVGIIQGPQELPRLWPQLPCMIILRVPPTDLKIVLPHYSQPGGMFRVYRVYG